MSSSYLFIFLMVYHLLRNFKFRLILIIKAWTFIIIAFCSLSKKIVYFQVLQLFSNIFFQKLYGFNNCI
jgi:hypothetical protein